MNPDWVWALSKLAQGVSQNLFSQVEQAISEITQKPFRDSSSGSLCHLLLATLPYIGWGLYLRILTQHQQSDLIQDLVYLGGVVAMRGLVEAMKAVCSQWREAPSPWIGTL